MLLYILMSSLMKYIIFCIIFSDRKNISSNFVVSFDALITYIPPILYILYSTVKSLPSTKY